MKSFADSKSIWAAGFAGCSASNSSSLNPAFSFASHWRSVKRADEVFQCRPCLQQRLFLFRRASVLIRGLPFRHRGIPRRLPSLSYSTSLPFSWAAATCIWTGSFDKNRQVHQSSCIRFFRAWLTADGYGASFKTIPGGQSDHSYVSCFMDAACGYCLPFQAKGCSPVPCPR